MSARCSRWAARAASGNTYRHANLCTGEYCRARPDPGIRPGSKAVTVIPRAPLSEPAVEFVGEQHVAQLGGGVTAPAVGGGVGVRVSQFLGRGVLRFRHARELRRVVRAAADDDDPRGRDEVVEQSGDEREVPEMIDAEGQFDAVVGVLQAVHGLQAGVADHGVQRRQIWRRERRDEFADGLAATRGRTP